MSIRTDPKTQTRTVYCDGCGRMAPICAAPGASPVALLNALVQGWQANDAEQKCPECRAIRDMAI